MAVLQITEAYLKTCALPVVGQILIYDQSLTGFGARLNPKSIVFFVEKRLGRTATKRRITIGQHPHFSVAEARREAGVVIGELVQGIDRKALDRAQVIKTIPLEALLSDYIHKRTLKLKTAERYQYCFRHFLKDWQSMPWTSLTGVMVKVRHKEISQSSGPGSANYSMRALSAVINYGMGIYTDEDGNPLIPENPTLILSRTKSWIKLKPRTGFINEANLKQWWQGIENLNNSEATDFLKLLILTGLRKTEALSLPWSNIDFERKTLTVLETKNGDQHVLPLPPYLLEILQLRRMRSNSEFVFPGEGQTGHMVEIKRSIHQANKLCGLSFTCHDLRRSFAVYADNLEISSNGIKRLLNHKSTGDVTFAHYLPFNIGRLRDPMARINDYILKAAGVVASAPVISIQSQDKNLKQSA